MLIPPEHDRSSCSDDNLINAEPNSSGYVRCIRCALLRAQVDKDYGKLLQCNELSINLDKYYKLRR